MVQRKEGMVFQSKNAGFARRMEYVNEGVTTDKTHSPDRFISGLKRGAPVQQQRADIRMAFQSSKMQRRPILFQVTAERMERLFVQSKTRVRMADGIGGPRCHNRLALRHSIGQKCDSQR